jgi:uncharacterized protein DUF4154
MNMCLRDRAGKRWGWNGRLVGRTRRFLLFIIVYALALTASPRADAPNEDRVEYRVKLAFIYNFTRFVEWPSSSYRNSGAPLSICIVGSDPFSSDLEDELRTRTVGGHSVEVRRLRRGEAIGACQILFIPQTANDRAASIVKELKGSSTLTVGEADGFAMRGGIINFAVEENRLHLEVNPLAADRAGLKISSKLLNIATIVKER